MDARITITGNVGTAVEAGTSKLGRPFASFRLACSPGYWDRAKQQWVEEGTVWLRVRCHGELARNVAASVQKGQPLTVAGRLRVDTWVDTFGVVHERFEVVADEVGHNLALGTANFVRQRMVRASHGDAPADDAAWSEEPAAGDGEVLIDQLSAASQPGDEPVDGHDDVEQPVEAVA